MSTVNRKVMYLKEWGGWMIIEGLNVVAGPFNWKLEAHLMRLLMETKQEDNKSHEQQGKEVR